MVILCLKWHILVIFLVRIISVRPVLGNLLYYVWAPLSFVLLHTMPLSSPWFVFVLRGLFSKTPLYYVAVTVILFLHVMSLSCSSCVYVHHGLFSESNCNMLCHDRYSLSYMVYPCRMFLLAGEFSKNFSTMVTYCLTCRVFLATWQFVSEFLSYLSS